MAYLIILTIISMGICYQVARRRGLRPGFWIFMGLLFGPFAIPFAYLVRSPRSGGDAD